MRVTYNLSEFVRIINLHFNVTQKSEFYKASYAAILIPILIMIIN